MNKEHRQVYVAHWAGLARRANRYVLRAMRENLPGVADMYRADRAQYMQKARSE